jgi:hypothetical protein
MSEAGEGSGTFRFKAVGDAVNGFKSLPKEVQGQAKALMINNLAEPARDYGLAEGQRIAAGMVRDGNAFSFLSLRFSYNPQTHTIFIVDVAVYMKDVPGPH